MHGDKPPSNLDLSGWATRLDDVDSIPPPPYQVTAVEMIFVGVQYHPDDVGRLLPKELRPLADSSGTACVYTVGQGWGIAPYTACFLSIAVEGFDAPDGSPGYYMAAGFFSGRAGIVMARDYNTNLQLGMARSVRESGVLIGEGGPPGATALTIRVRPTGDSPFVSGVHHYLGRNKAGGLNLYAVAFTGNLCDATPESVEIGKAFGESLQLAGGVRPVWALDCREGSLTFGAPQAVLGASSAAAMQFDAGTLLDGFSRIGRAAIIVGAGGEIGLINPLAERLLGDGLELRGGAIAASRPKEQADLRRAIALAAGQHGRQVDIEPIAIERAGARPLLVQIMPVGDAATGRPSALVLLNDPAAEPAGSPLPALQLLGLTPAEARIAELVGSGMSPREAAERLDNSEGTVRTSLIRIYQKLDINRQSELARIVARL